MQQNQDNGDDTNFFRFCGEYFDRESGSTYLRARYYSPSDGRFFTEDSAADGLNWYTYADNDPVGHWDPSGNAMTPVREAFPTSQNYTVNYDNSTKTATVYQNGKFVSSYTNGQGSTRISNGVMYIDYIKGGTISKTPTTNSQYLVKGAGMFFGMVGKMADKGVTIVGEGYMSGGGELGAVGEEAGLLKSAQEVEDAALAGKAAKGARTVETARNFIKYSPSQIEKKFKLNRNQFHREVKPELLKDANKYYPKETRQLGNNPDILLDNDGFVQFKATNGSGKSLTTDLNINNYLP